MENNNTGYTYKTVLLVDDNAVLLRTVKDMLADRYDVNIAISGAQAFMSMQKKLPDIILLDYEMPYSDGGKVFEKIRSHPQTMNIPVIFFTASAEREVVEKLLALKPDGYMLKPPSKDKLIKIIDKTLGIEQHEENNENTNEEQDAEDDDIID